MSESNKEEVTPVTRAGIEDRIDQLLGLEQTGSEDRRKYYDVASSLVEQWQQRPLSSQDKPLKDTTVRVEIADLHPWVERHTEDQIEQHPPLKYVALFSPLEAPVTEEATWKGGFKFYKDGSMVLEAEEIIRTLPDPDDPNPAKSTDSWTSRSIRDVKRPISPEDLRVLDGFLDHIVPLKKS